MSDKHGKDEAKRIDLRALRRDHGPPKNNARGNHTTNPAASSHQQTKQTDKRDTEKHKYALGDEVSVFNRKKQSWYHDARIIDINP
eukprot:1393243-Amorphochlora_amoeboformis.AAC.2